MKGVRGLLYYLGIAATLLSRQLPAQSQALEREFYSRSHSSQIDTTNASLEKRVRELKTRDGKLFFSSEQISALNRASAFENALTFVNRDKSFSYAPGEIVKYSKLGVKKSEVDRFKDTEKPNAVLIFPSEVEDISDVSAFYNRFNRAIINDLRRGYDLLVKIVSLESQIDAALDVAKNAELLILAGHGSKTNLVLGESKQSSLRETENGIFSWDGDETPTEQYTLSLDDSEDLSNYFRKLSPNAVIFLSSCSTAEEDPLNNNFANVVRRASNYRKVIAAKKLFSSEGITVDSIYPLSLRIIAQYTSGATEDVTYIGKSFGEIDKTLPKVDLLRTKTLKVARFY